ncbi:MAG TPA: 1,2-phenylacetyl-CoA epoxidase subunit PaaC [Gaiellaceae bacterium]|nr:1,2-phenylacetyl-CoA epoxidase subunit PaaC [Gaiellaceae bacterium]
MTETPRDTKGARVTGSPVPESAQRILELADDELILGWRNSEWTGIAPFLEEDVAFSSIAQTEIGHARAWYELAAKELGTDADALAFDREPDEYVCAPLVEMRMAEDWARTIARHWLYETADSIRIQVLINSVAGDIRGLAEKIDREEAYHRMHADMWAERLRDEPAFREAVDELWPYALGVLSEGQRPLLCQAVDRDEVEAIERGEHTDDLRPLWEEMTMVRRSVPGATW